MVKRHTKTSGKTFFCGHWDTLCPTDLHFFQYICDNRFMQRLVKITSSFAVVFISTAVSLPEIRQIIMKMLVLTKQPMLLQRPRLIICCCHSAVAGSLQVQMITANKHHFPYCANLITPSEKNSCISSKFQMRCGGFCRWASLSVSHWSPQTTKMHCKMHIQDFSYNCNDLCLILQDTAAPQDPKVNQNLVE